jgi:hypothetical protein
MLHNVCRDQYSWNINKDKSLPPIIFMGLLDSVGAKGIPTIRLKAAPDQIMHYPESFHDICVSSEVQHVFQAASVHDRFGPFQHCAVRRSSKLLLAEAGRAGGYTGNYPGVKFTTKEVWFPGGCCYIML